MLEPLTVRMTTNWNILKEMGISDHLTCLLRNLYAGQEATVQPRHGTRDIYICHIYMAYITYIFVIYVKAVYCHPAYLAYMQSTSGEMPG